MPEYMTIMSGLGVERKTVVQSGQLVYVWQHSLRFVYGVLYLCHKPML